MEKGARELDKGHNLVPVPPAIITGSIFDIGVLLKFIKILAGYSIFLQLFLGQSHQIYFTPGSHVLSAYDYYAEKSWYVPGNPECLVDIFLVAC